MTEDMGFDAFLEAQYEDQFYAPDLDMDGYDEYPDGDEDVDYPWCEDCEESFDTWSDYIDHECPGDDPDAGLTLALV